MSREKFFRYVLGNIVIGLGIIAVVSVAVVFRNESKLQNAPIYSGESDTKVSLMVNVYWGNEYIEPMLDIFSRYNVNTTFFVGGVWAAKNSDLLEKIHADGHEIGNHGYYHKDHDKISETANYNEIDVTHKLVKSILGIDMTLFAPPSGAFSDVTLQQASKLGYTTILWTRDTIDWRDKNTDLIRTRALNNIKGGDLILMHPTANTAEALEDIITGIYSKGLTPSTVSETLKGTVTA